MLISLIVEGSPSWTFNSNATLFLAKFVTVVDIDALYLPLSKYNLTNSCSILSKIFLSYGWVLEIPTSLSAEIISSSSIILLSVIVILDTIGFSVSIIIRSLKFLSS